MLPTLFPPTPVPMKVSTRELGSKPTGTTVLGAVVVDMEERPDTLVVRLEPRFEAALGVDLPQPPSAVIDTTTKAMTESRPRSGRRFIRGCDRRTPPRLNARPGFGPTRNRSARLARYPAFSHMHLGRQHRALAPRHVSSWRACAHCHHRSTPGTVVPTAPTARPATTMATTSAPLWRSAAAALRQRPGDPRVVDQQDSSVLGGFCFDHEHVAIRCEVVGRPGSETDLHARQAGHRRNPPDHLPQGMFSGNGGQAAGRGPGLRVDDGTTATLSQFEPVASAMHRS